MAVTAFFCNCNMSQRHNIRESLFKMNFTPLYWVSPSTVLLGGLCDALASCNCKQLRWRLYCGSKEKARLGSRSRKAVRFSDKLQIWNLMRNSRNDFMIVMEVLEVFGSESLTSLYVIFCKSLILCLKMISSDSAQVWLFGCWILLSGIFFLRLSIVFVCQMSNQI